MSPVGHELNGNRARTLATLPRRHAGARCQLPCSDDREADAIRSYYALVNFLVTENALHRTSHGTGLPALIALFLRRPRAPQIRVHLCLLRPPPEVHSRDAMHAADRAVRRA